MLNKSIPLLSINRLTLIKRMNGLDSVESVYLVGRLLGRKLLLLN